jgi:hypothetical protein
MAVTGLPIGGKAIQGQAQDLAREVGYGALGQDKKAAVIGHQTEATVALCSIVATLKSKAKWVR